MNLTADDVYRFRVAHCIGCGCHDFAACWDEKTGRPCHWKRLDNEAGLGVCSSCPDAIERWDKGDREPAVPVNKDEEGRGGD